MKDHDSQSLNARFTLKPLLDTLRAECGDSEFGYRMQAFFAHVLMRLGAVILEVNAQGHPDVRAVVAGSTVIVQVKSVMHSSPLFGFQLSSADLAGITTTEQMKGYLAILDCADPVSWIIVDFAKARQFVNRSIAIAGLRAAEESLMSKDCTEEFIAMMLPIRDRLSTLTFPLLVRRALEGRPI